MNSENIETIEGPKPCLIENPEVDGHSIEPTQEMKETEDLLTVKELAGVRGTNADQIIHEWQRSGDIIGWKDGQRGYVFPSGQFDQQGQRRRDLEPFVKLFDDIHELWDWLITPDDALDGEVPLALLDKGELDKVEAAAKGYLQGDFG